MKIDFKMTNHVLVALIAEANSKFYQALEKLGSEEDVHASMCAQLDCEAAQADVQALQAALIIVRKAA